MLNNIKSSYFINKIFSNVNEEQKLTLIKYNIKLQNIINISIINYKFFKGKYIKYETNRIRKEYMGFNDKLIFIGEYLNGQRKGKGKEYIYLRKLIF